MESVTELYVQKDENEYYVLITDMGEFQKVYIADHPLMDEYKRIIHLPNDEFKHEIDTFEASAIYVENKEASAWYDIKESPFEPAVKLTALVSKECPYGTEEKKTYLLRKYDGETNIFIYPGYEYKLVDSLITNFHLPGSTLIMLVSALSSKDQKYFEDYLIGELTEETYKEQLWDHQPLTDFWMVGRGTVSRLARVGIFTMRDIAMADEALLFRLFGVNAEILMDHAWGIEPVTMADIKKYRAKSRSISSGQVLARDYNYKDCRLIVKEMCDLLCLELVKQHKITDHIALSLGFSFNLDRRPLSVSEKLTVTTSSNRILTEAMMGLFDRIADPALYYRRVNLSFDNLKDEEMEQMDLFTDYEALEKEREIRKAEQDREKRMQKAILDIRKRFGNNAIVKGMNLEEGATAIERNSQIGGHNA